MKNDTHINVDIDTLAKWPRHIDLLLCKQEENLSSIKITQQASNGRLNFITVIQAKT